MDHLLFILSLCLKVFTLYFAGISVFALCKPKSTPHSAPRTRFAVVIAARNEERVIGSLIQSLQNQNYPSHLRDIYVIPNNCTDFTETAARTAGANIIHCIGPVRNKGDALHDAFQQLRGCGYDAFVVFDADNTADSDYLSRVNDAICAGAKVFKTRLKTANPSFAVAGCYGLYNALFDLIWNRPRAACGLSAKLVGTGFGFTEEVLEKMNGWNTSTIAEDAEFAAQCARLGYRVRWIPEAVSYDEAPTKFLVSLRQRKRWCSGVMQVAKKELGTLWHSPVTHPALRWDLTMFLLAPFSQVASTLLMAADLFMSILQKDVSRLWMVLICLSIYYAGGIILSAALCLAGGYGLRSMGRTMALFPLFMATWLPLQAASLFKDTKKWTPIVHTGCNTIASHRT